MAEYLASIFGTEKDKVNCSFYFKIGACRHGERCSRVHNKPTFSQTILLKNLYLNPNNNSIPKPEGGFEQFSGNTYTDEEVQQHFDEFYEEVYTEVEDKTSTTLASQIITRISTFLFYYNKMLFICFFRKNYGEIEAMTVCDNLGEHLVGNIYIKFRYERDAERAVEDLNTRWFDRKPIYAELSPVTDFKEASCRQYELGECMRSGFCNFMHIKTISQDVKKRLRGRRKRSRSHSHSPSRKNRRH
ncbi:unnamed protein product [Rotaria sp. Silwood1]|nr:unnamed protein product [Rotaria sp. Silwood1]CAF3499911.1 unnamed protein product [Rotaria sp. Silwood1]CAF3509000.1 unnamed protein product [Rotaria sp. Silwood1]